MDPSLLLLLLFLRLLLASPSIFHLAFNIQLNNYLRVLFVGRLFDRTTGKTEATEIPLTDSIWTIVSLGEAEKETRNTAHRNIGAGNGNVGFKNKTIFHDTHWASSTCGPTTAATTTAAAAAHTPRPGRFNGSLNCARRRQREATKSGVVRG